MNRLKMTGEVITGSIATILGLLIGNLSSIEVYRLVGHPPYAPPADGGWERIILDVALLGFALICALGSAVILRRMNSRRESSTANNRDWAYYLVLVIVYFVLGVSISIGSRGFRDFTRAVF